MRMLHIQLGKELTALIQDGKQKTTFLNELNERRKGILQDYATIPPSHTFDYSEKIGAYEYAFVLKGFGRIVYETTLWDIKKEPHQIFERILFHYERFLRKWATNAPDVAIEEKLKDQPFIIEYGEEWADLIETDTFFKTLQQTAKEVSLTFEEPPYWESDYVAKGQIVIYIFGKDHYVNREIDKTTEALLEEVIRPILREYHFSLKNAQ